MLTVTLHAITDLDDADLDEAFWAEVDRAAEQAQCMVPGGFAVADHQQDNSGGYTVQQGAGTLPAAASHM